MQVGQSQLKSPSYVPICFFFVYYVSEMHPGGSKWFFYDDHRFSKCLRFAFFTVAQMDHNKLLSSAKSWVKMLLGLGSVEAKVT